MAIKKFKLKGKKLIATDVFELTFETEERIELISGQFITFILDKIGGRAYSVLDTDGNNIKFIIKRWSKEMGGRGGSIFICDLEVGYSLNGVGPAGKFVLKDNNKPKLFLGTGTGFVPLYNQIIGAIDSDIKLKLIFGVRGEKDLFYLEELNKLKEKNQNFDYEIYLSREDLQGTKKGYITDFLTSDNTKLFDEYYICGFPGMIDSTIDKLKENGINEDDIFTERY